MHAAYWRRHTAPLGLPTALDVGKEEELEDFGCFFGRAGVGRTTVSGPVAPIIQWGTWRTVAGAEGLRVYGQ